MLEPSTGGMLASLVVACLTLTTVSGDCFDVNIEYRGGRVLTSTGPQTPGWRSDKRSSQPRVCKCWCRSAQSCSQSCSSQLTCSYWTWRGGRCELRSDISSKVTRLGSISGAAGQEDCVRGVECHYLNTDQLVSCVTGNVTK